MLDNLNDGDIGAGVTGTGLYAIPNSGDLILDFGAPSILTGIAIYNGYGNRDNGSYTLRDDMGVTLGAWNIAGTAGAGAAGVDSFWLSFITPVATSSLTLRGESRQNNRTVSYREIQVFSSSAAVPEPTTIAIFALGALGLGSRRFKN
ncbi:PEP-CTERM sorting domain-containing protein [Pseudomonadales bacterium]|nr:PEP-CTERM sorting domain-containing protein [Pseudomonadales bacterium]MDB2543287.1 PEP-CTERM sorting domain-containing protein [Pseudomonadales bacterium]